MKNNSINPALDRTSNHPALEREYFMVAGIGGAYEPRAVYKVRLALRALSARCATLFTRRSA